MPACHRLLVLLLSLWAPVLTAQDAPEAVPAAPDLGVAVPALPDAVGELPVLHQGRVKPLMVAAEELTYAITGKGSLAQRLPDPAHPQSTGTVHTPPTALVCAWMLGPERWQNQRVLYVPYLPLQRALGLTGQWISLAQLQSGIAASIIGGALAKKERSDLSHERLALSKTEAAAISVAGRAEEVRATFAGDTLSLMPLAPDAPARAALLGQAATLLPVEPEPEEAAWRGRLRMILARPEAERAAALAKEDIWLTVGDVLHDPLLARIPDPLLQAGISDATAWLHAVATGDAAAIHQAQLLLVGALRAQAAREDGAPYPSAAKLRAECLYHAAHPFTWTWLCYLLGGTLSAIGLAHRRPAAGGVPSWASHLYHLGVLLTLAGLALNLYGLGTRVYITNLGMVTNLFETLVYVALICAGLGLLLARLTGTALYAAAGGVAAALCAMVGEALPPDLGSHLGQLQPVLRSQFWLWTHVKTVVASYAAFVLAWAIGNAVLVQAFLRGRAVTRDQAAAIYRCLQVGVVLIAAGTLLGAVWADQAWGRFWGWDPKEVWALAILLTYLVPLHLRYAGLVGPTGLAGWAVFGMLSVVMSWYGVNFLLGTGLHAYAFGTGGQGYVLSLCLLQIVVTAWLLWRLRRLPASEPPSEPAGLPTPAGP